VISAEDLDFSNEAKETLACQYDGEDMEIGFNARFLLEMLSNIDSEDITLELSTPNRAGLLMPAQADENESILMLVMPETSCLFHIHLSFSPLVWVYLQNPFNLFESVMKKSEIRFSIALDDQKVPEAISWQATDAGQDIHFAKAINISIWDRNADGTMKIDLWTKDMPTDAMKYFVVDTIGSMAETIITATSDQKMAAKMRALCQELTDYLEEQGQDDRPNL
nr:hypothetical protein [Tanacetum cinerariifolium]